MHVVNALDHFAQKKLRDTDFAEMSGFDGRKRGKGRDQQRGPTRLGNSPPI